MKWTTLRLLGALFAVALLAAACGSDIAETTTTADATETETVDETADSDAMEMDEEHDDHDDEHSDDDHSGHDDHDHASVIEVADGAPVPAVEIALDPTGTDGLYNLSVTLTNFTITPENIDGDPVDNEGHMHLLIDGVKIGRFTDLETTVQVPDGEHLVEVELNANNHSAYAVDGTPIRAGLTVSGAGEASAIGETMVMASDEGDEEHGSDDDHDHDHGSAVGAIEGDLTIDDADVAITAMIVNGEVSGVESRTSVPLGSIVAITVISDTDDEVHLHGYDILDDVPASDIGLIIFTADTPGRFELELEQAGTFITELEIS